MEIFYWAPKGGRAFLQGGVFAAGERFQNLEDLHSSERTGRLFALKRNV